MKKGVTIYWFILWALFNTLSCLVVCEWSWRTCFHTYVRRIITIIEKRAIFNASTSQWISITIVSTDIWTPWNTRSRIRISKIARISTIKHTNIIIWIIVRWRRTFEDTLVCWIISIRISIWRTNIHTFSIMKVSKGIQAVLNTLMSSIVSKVRWIAG